MPPAATKSKYGKISKSQILTTPHPQGHVMSVRCEQPLDELTVQVWLLYDHPNFKYCTLYISGTELRTDKRTDDPNTRCPRRTFQAGGIKIIVKFKFTLDRRGDSYILPTSFAGGIIKSWLKSSHGQADQLHTLQHSPYTCIQKWREGTTERYVDLLSPRKY